MGIRRCAWCGRYLGPAPGIPRGEETTGICTRCLRKIYEEEGLYPLPQDDHPEAVFGYGLAALLGGCIGGLTAWALGISPWLGVLAGSLVGMVALAIWFWTHLRRAV